MQQMSAPGGCGCARAHTDAPHAPARSGLPPRPLAPARPQRQQRQPTLVPRAFAGAAAPALSAGAGFSASTGLLSYLSFALGGVGLVLLLADQVKQEARPNPECSTCEGTGLVPCVCQRWSDGDRGCSICAGSGRMSCPSCGGGGTAVPIAARAQATRGTSLMEQQRRM